MAWLGDCQTGVAEGVGVLVHLVPGIEPERFYGKLEHGLPTLGVLQTDGGFLAGRWSHGTLVPPLPDDVAQRNLVLDAFRAAAAAAGAASRSYAARADAATSRFYAKQARLLSQQVD